MGTRKKQKGKDLLIYMILFIWLLIFGIPFYVMVITGFKQPFEVLMKPVWSFPSSLKITNYIEILKGNFFIFFKNSLIVSIVSVLLIILISAMASYVLARIDFKCNKILFMFILAGMSVPIHVTLIPIYLLTNKLGIYDSLMALVGPYVAMNIPLSTFILTEFMRGIPKELEESARIDGCSTKRIFWNIIMPLTKPGLATIGIYSFVSIWNEFIFALVLTSSKTTRTLPLGIWEYQGQYSSNIPMVMGVLTLSAFPLIIAYLLGQDKIVDGMMAGAIKG